MEKKLSVIIVNWNGRDLLRGCIQSIRDQNPTFTYDIIVVDNASFDGSVEFLQSLAGDESDRIRVIFNKENVGFGRANNQAMAASSSQFFLLLNSDVELMPGVFANLVRVAESDATIGAVAPRLRFPDGSIQHSVWPIPSPWRTLAVGLRLYRFIPEKKRAALLLGNFWQHDKEISTATLPATALLIRAEVFSTLGGFDEDFFMYGEDLEYTARMRKAGWKLVFTPTAEVMHRDAQSSVARWGYYEKYRRQSGGQIRFMEKTMSRSQVRANCWANLFVYALEIVWRGIRRMPADDVRASFGVYFNYICRRRTKNYESNT